MFNKPIFIFITILTSLLFMQTSCKVGPTSPVLQPPQDTTSHNLSVIRIDTLGDLFSNARAVDIIDVNNIYVAGEFYEKDGNNYNLKYNFAHWDGEKWIFIAIKMQGIGGTADTSIHPLVALKVFSDSNIIVISYYNSQAHWNGKKWASYTIDPKIGYVQHMWARSQNEIFFCGEMGSATYYNGQTFSKMMTGLTSRAVLIDVWGDENSVYTLGSSNDMKENAIMYTANTSIWTIANKYSIENKTPAPSNMYMGRLNSIFRANKNSKLWVLGGEDYGSLYEITSLAPFIANEIFKIPESFIPKLVRGNADNDLFLFSSHSEIWHFNGKTWKMTYPEPYFRMFNCTVKGNTIVLVGETFEFLARGIVVILQRH